MALVALGLGLFWWMNRGHTSTDDAYIQANITMIAPRISGTVVRVPVTDNQRVEAGALLFELDPADHEARLRQVSADLTAAEARVQVARAELDMTRTRAPAALAQAAAAVRSARARAEKAAADERRYEALFAKDQIPRQVLEQARSSHLALQAEAEGVQAGLRGAQTLAQQIAAQEAALASAEATVAQAQAARDQAGILQLRAQPIRHACRRAGEAGTDLVGDAPGWWRRGVEHARSRGAYLGFLYGWDGSRWWRLDQPVDDGFDPELFPVTRAALRDIIDDLADSTLLDDGTAAAVTRPWLFVFPAFVLIILLFAISLVGDALRRTGVQVSRRLVQDEELG